jgi:hypothetical protein
VPEVPFAPVVVSVEVVVLVEVLGLGEPGREMLMPILMTDTSEIRA